MSNRKTKTARAERGFFVGYADASAAMSHGHECRGYASTDSDIRADLAWLIQSAAVARNGYYIAEGIRAAMKRWGL